MTPKITFVLGLCCLSLAIFLLLIAWYGFGLSDPADSTSNPAVQMSPGGSIPPDVDGTSQQPEVPLQPTREPLGVGFDVTTTVQSIPVLRPGASVWVAASNRYVLTVSSNYKTITFDDLADEARLCYQGTCLSFAQFKAVLRAAD